MCPGKSSSFYSHLPVTSDFFDASRQELYHPLPEDWYVAVTDIVNSTSAIANNRYKRVNILGASPIVGILNITDKNEIPYTFGGDGAIFCIPPTHFGKAKKVLAECRYIGKTEYGLDLRAALIPVSYIRRQGYDVQVARYQASEHYIQAIFSGGGIGFAEDALKQPGIEKYRINAAEKAKEIDFSGLECRWQEVSRPDKEVITLMVQSNPGHPNEQRVYARVLRKLREIFGFDNQTNPIDSRNLKMNISPFKWMGEVKFRTAGKSWPNRILYVLKTGLQIIVGKIMMKLNFKTSNTDWGLYKTDMALNSDHRKFDDMLRLVISGSPDQRRRLEAFLQEQYEQDQLAYGLHIADAAMITCMVFQYHREHVHFVDGKNGGYVSASKKLKTRLQQLSD